MFAILADQLSFSAQPTAQIPQLTMRLATLHTPNGPRAFPRAGDRYVDLNTSIRALLAGGPEAMNRAKAMAARADATSVPVAGARHAPVVPDPMKIMCIGLNYRDHAIEG